ncbi:hypothetical protein DRQ09_07390 [candidate division KSB1 bacterium]|nr:MAG: hypothetical protein DRQ09_07390 [candidate division KSB1 bacterium]
MFKSFVIIIVIIFGLFSTVIGQEISVKSILQDMSESFVKLAPEKYKKIIQFNIKDDEQMVNYWVNLMEGSTVNTGKNKEAFIIFISDKLTLTKIYKGELNALTAAGRAKLSDRAPLDILPGKGVSFSQEFLLYLYYYLCNFFNTAEIKRIKFGSDYSRFIHGAYAVALFYDKNFRSAWYEIKKGERLNKEGDTNPFPQLLIIIEGNGFLKYGDKTVEIKKGEAIYIPPDTVHILWTEGNKPLRIIWLAWGEKA